MLRIFLIIAGLIAQVYFSPAFTQSAPSQGTVCTDKVINGQTVRRCIYGTPPPTPRHEPVDINIPAPNVPILRPTPVNPPAPPNNPIVPVNGPGDIDINGAPIPATPTAAIGSFADICEYPGRPPRPGVGGHVSCGSFKIPVIGSDYNYSAFRSGGDALAAAYLFVLPDYRPGSTLLNKSIRFHMAGDAAVVFKFRTGPPGDYLTPREGVIGYDKMSNRGPLSDGATLVLSEKKCNFDVPKLGTTPCYSTVMLPTAMPLNTAATGM